MGSTYFLPSERIPGNLLGAVRIRGSFWALSKQILIEAISSILELALKKEIWPTQLSRNFLDIYVSSLPPSDL